MKENGSLIRLKDMENTCIQMVLNMKAIGKQICSMDKALRLGLTDLFSLDNTEKARRMELESINGQMVLAMKVSG